MIDLALRAVCVLFGHVPDNCHLPAYVCVRCHTLVRDRD